jgi:hypothetical protein
MNPNSNLPAARSAVPPPRPSRFVSILSILGASAALSVLAPVFSGTVPPPYAETVRGRSVFYVAREGESFAFRAYSPEGGSVLVGKTGSRPENIFWRDDFSELYYRVGNRMMKRNWKAGSDETEALVLPEETDLSGKFWIDDDTGRWRYFRVAEPGETAEVFEYSGRKKKWKQLASEPTHGCRSGDESACGLEVRSFTKGQKRTVSLEELSHEMRVWSHLSKLNVMIKNDPGLWPFFLPSANEPDATLQITVRIGKTLHGIAPLVRLSKSGGSKTEIYGALEPGCPREVAFLEFQRWVLAAAENTGQCGRVADLRDGRIVFRLPEQSEGAVWVPSPAAGEPPP